MADEIRVNASLQYEDDELTTIALSLSEFIGDITTKLYVKHKHNVGTSEEAMELGALSALGWCIAVNRDDTNFVEIRSATGASNDIIKIPAGAAALFHFGSNVTAPYIIADTAACQVEYLILNT